MISSFFFLLSSGVHGLMKGHTLRDNEFNVGRYNIKYSIKNNLSNRYGIALTTWLTVTFIPRCDIFLMSDRVLLAVHVLVHFTTVDFINLVSARLQRLVWNRTRRWLSLFTNAPGRLTCTFPRVN